MFSSRLIRSGACIAGLFGLLFFAAPRLCAQPSVQVFFEDFDAVLPPAAPPDWVISGGWETSGSVPSDGSGAQNLFITGSPAGLAATPALDLTSFTAATLSYRARRTSTFDPTAFVVTASSDGGATFPDTLLGPGAAMPEDDGAYVVLSVEVPSALVGQPAVAFRFEAAGGNGGNARLDDVAVIGVLPFGVTPLALFLDAAPGETDAQEVTVTNTGIDDLPLDPPVLSGEGFSITPADAVILAAGASREYVVTFAPAAEGAREGTLHLTAAGQTAVTVALTGTTGGSGFGFEAPLSAVLEETHGIEVPLALEHVGEVPLQGLQFTLTWDDDALSFLSLTRGSGIADEAVWTLATDASSRSVRVVLLGEGVTGLSAGAYPALLTLRFATGTVAPSDAAEVHLAVEDLVGALALPTGDDAGLAPRLGAHTLTVERRRAFFSAQPDSLDAGTAPVGEAGQVVVTVTNPGGTRDLVLTEAVLNDSLFTVAPAGGTVPPGGALDFTVTFTPAATDFGRQDAELSFTHDGEAGPTARVPVTALGTGGRGDASPDGVVDALDLILALDFVLGRLSPEPAQKAASDLSLFPGGDDALDVRDLTVLAQAIARGLWPDAAPVPFEARPPVLLAKQGSLGPISVRLHPVLGGLRVDVDHQVPLRALQLVLGVTGASGAPEGRLSAERASGTSLLGTVDEAKGSVRLLFYRNDGGASRPGSYPLAFLPTAAPGTVTVRYAVAVGMARKGLGVNVDVGLGTGSDADGEIVPGFELGRPYPNPMGGEAAVLYLPLRLPAAAAPLLEVFDVLGRRVVLRRDGRLSAGLQVLQWDGRDAHGRRMGAGLYLVRVSAGPFSAQRSVVLVR